MDTVFIRDSVEPVVSALNNTSIFAFDIETTGLSPLDSRILLMQFGVGDTAFVIDYAGCNDTLLLRPYLEDPTYTKIIHNVKFEAEFMYFYWKVMLAGCWDTMLAEKILDPDGLASVSLAATTQRYLGIELEKETRKSFYEGPNLGHFTDEQIAYAAKDVEVLFPIQKAQREKLEAADLMPVALLEFDTAPVVSRMELTGIPINQEGWKEKIREYRILHKQANDRMYEELFDKGGLDEQMGLFERSAINLDSNKQVLIALQKLGLDIAATDERTIKALNHPVREPLLEYRRIQKILTSYAETFLGKIHPFTGRLHPDYQQLGTETGRFSCREPNVQQIPPEFRQYVTDPEFKILSADYAQIELRILAQVSQDKRLLDAFNSGQDLHKVTASLMFGVPVEEVTKLQRSTAKTLNFGILYGMGGPKLMDKLNEGREGKDKLTLTQTQDIHKRYKDTYRRSIQWLANAGEHAWNYGSSTTLYGRKRYYNRPTNAVDEKQYMKQMMGLKRQGANSVIQGTSADMTKLAMVDLQDKLDYYGYRSNIIIQVHDELVILAHKSQAEAVKTVIEESMRSAGEKLVKSVPIEVDIHISDVWSKE